ncbi:LytR C-terminal domain-containing protein [Curtobacterium ammoniigenes]|uniref:LytR C-terminal domain-containing protein n=1 Tax=Curtobacterium ammoniigenes TaxID=395387 RepID=UPI00082CB084|nr:LytR C-terminal domain-containing protein [Curtobacterium ammoniigenes]
MTRFPRDRFDDVTDGPRVGAHRSSARKGRGWAAFGWAALATAVVAALAIVIMGGLSGLNSGITSAGASGGPGASASASASGTASASASAQASSPSATPSAPATATPSQQTAANTIEVLNGTRITGLAAKGGAALIAAGWKVAGEGNAGSTGTTTSVVYYKDASDLAVANGVAKTLGIASVQASSAFPNSAITVVLGSDY